MESRQMLTDAIDGMSVEDLATQYGLTRTRVRGALLREWLDQGARAGCLKAEHRARVSKYIKQGIALEDYEAEGDPALRRILVAVEGAAELSPEFVQRLAEDPAVQQEMDRISYVHECIRQMRQMRRPHPAADDDATT